MQKQTIIWGLIAIAVLGIAWYVITQTSPMETLYSQSQEALTRTLTIRLDQQNNSGETGIAVLTDIGGKTQVELRLTGAPVDVLQPAHIHTGTCATITGVKYPLVFPMNGSSITVLELSLDSLLAELPLAINVHKSAMEAGVYYACGDIAK